VEKVDTLPPSEKERLIPVSIEVSRAKGKKCERCWKYHEKTGDDPEHPSVCPTCADVIRRNY